FGVGFNRRDSPPVAGTIHKREIFVFASRSTSTQSNTTHLPSGDGTGAPTRLSFIMSSNVKGCLAFRANTDIANERMITSSFFIGRKTLAEALHVQGLYLGSTGCQSVAFGSWRFAIRRWAI